MKGFNLDLDNLFPDLPVVRWVGVPQQKYRAGSTLNLIIRYYGLGRDYELRLGGRVLERYGGRESIL